jgi:hypothetical protein
MDDNKGMTTNVSIKTVINSKYFNLGYKDYIENRSFNVQYDHWEINDQMDYERGRHYASVFGNDKTFIPKIGHKVNETAIIAAQAMVNRYLLI